MLSINCYILGYNPNHVFTVEISETANADNLREMIKEKMALKVDAARLVLWRVDLPTTIIFQKDLDLSKIESICDESLFSLGELSCIFPDLDATRVHVLIKCPSDAKPG